MASVQDALEDGQTTVGTRVNVAHLAATPCGMKVRFVTELTAVSPNGKGLTFNVAAYDETGLIGEGVHERWWSTRKNSRAEPGIRPARPESRCQGTPLFFARLLTALRDCGRNRQWAFPVKIVYTVCTTRIAGPGSGPGTSEPQIIYP